MRQTIAYSVSAALHIALVASLFSTRATEEETVIGLPEQLTIDLQVLPSPKQEFKQESKPIFAKAVKPLPRKKRTKKIAKKTPINQAPEPLLKESQIDTSNTEVSSPTSVVAANIQTNIEPIATSKRQIENKSESLIIHNPTYKTQRPVKYPKSAKRKKLQGTVIIRAAIDSSGYVQKAWVYKSSGHAALDRSAVRSVEAWTFAPAQQGKLTVASTVQFPVVFQLK